MSVEEAVARMFPAGTSYDRVQAKRMIHWLDKCGYAIVPKAQVKPKATPAAEKPRKAA
jgi:hypothetical protein